MSHLGETVSEVTTSNPSAHEINDLSACLLTQTKWLLFTYARGLSLSLSLFIPLQCLSLCHSARPPSVVVAKVREAQLERAGSRKREGEGGSEQISVLPGRPPAKVCLALEGMKEGRAAGWEGWCGGGGVGGGDGEWRDPLYPGQ